MAEFEEKLNSILGNQEAMGQIMALARSLSGEQSPPADGGAQAGEEPPAPSAPEGAPPDLSALLGQVNPKLLQTGLQLMGQLQEEEARSTALLNALRPFLREERRARLDRAIQLTRMTKLLRAALTAFGGKEGQEGV